MIRLLYVVDPMCSWCWGFAPVIQQLRDSGDYRIEVVTGGLRAGETRGMTTELRNYVTHHWHQVGEVTGQPFEFEGALPDGFVYDTEPACRAVVTMREYRPEATLAYLHALQQAFYAQGRDITQLEELAMLAAEQGMEPERFKQHWQSDLIQIATATDFERKEQLGVMGFPSLLVDTGQRLRMVSMGYQDHATIQRQIERRMTRAAQDRKLH